METFEHEADPTAGSTSEGAAPSESSDTPESQDAPSSQSDQADSSSESSEAAGQGGSLLAGTSSELEPGVGGTGDHPAPAAMLDPSTGQLHQAGEPPSGGVAVGQAPAGDSTDLQSGDLSPEAQAALDNAPHEPEQVEIDRPDIGTPE